MGHERDGQDLWQIDLTRKRFDDFSCAARRAFVENIRGHDVIESTRMSKRFDEESSGRPGPLARAGRSTVSAGPRPTEVHVPSLDSVAADVGRLGRRFRNHFCPSSPVYRDRVLVIADSDELGEFIGVVPAGRLPDGVEAVRRGDALVLLNSAAGPRTVLLDGMHRDLLTGSDTTDSDTTGAVDLGPEGAVALIERTS